uniref:C2H2-type domain-containing protein n=1 Tax=Globisporangium ultimum (strain ATCC 200006 / CBS 805.95 / DAOM BR144) TaxID=431595 RepID=K3X1Y2_GLOUD
MKTSSSRRANNRVPAAPPRFCWRERTEKVNWRMLRALHLPDVIKRGDPSVLEPYVLHLTFARLPVSTASVAGADAMENVHRGANRYRYDEGDGTYDQRNAWFIVRIFQLATEYLLFMRSRDGTVLETMKKELELCERDCEEFVARTAKWKERARSGDKQVQKLHQVLQNVAKLLQIQGATPSSVATIETLLTELVSRQKKRNSHYRIANGDGEEDDLEGDDSEDEQKRIKEARQCFYCGKMFASAVYLKKHHLRRHPGENKELRLNEFPKYKPRQHANSTSAPIEDNGSREKTLRQMLLQVEHALQDHQESLRSLAKEETVKIQHFYEQLHAENQLAEEIKASRIQAEKKVEETQQQLGMILQEKEDAVAQLGDLKEQIQFLDLKRKMEIQSGIHSSVLPVSSVKPDISMTLEIKRLEQTLDLNRGKS